MTTYLTQQEYSAAKRRLTTLENKLRKAAPENGNYALPARDTTDPRIPIWRAIVAEVDRTFAEWDRKVYPDNWHRWNIARDDADYQLRMAGR